MSSCEIFVGLVSEKWLFLCVETAIPPLVAGKRAVSRVTYTHRAKGSFPFLWFSFVLFAVFRGFLETEQIHGEK